MLEVREGPIRPTQFDAPEGEAQEHALIDRRHFALVFVDRQLEPPGEKSSDAAFDALACPLALDQDQQIVGITRGALCSLARSLSASLAAGDSTRCAWTLISQWALPALSHLACTASSDRFSQNKNMSFPCTTAAFTLSAVTLGLRDQVPTRPQTRPSMRFLFVGSHVCTWASSRQTLAGLPLPSASGYPDDIGSSHRGLSPHKLMPMSGVHLQLHRNANSRLRRLLPPGELGWAASRRVRW